MCFSSYTASRKCDPKFGSVWEVTVSEWDYRHEPSYLARFPLEAALICFQAGSHCVTLTVEKLARQTRLAVNSWSFSCNIRKLTQRKSPYLT